MHGYKNIEANPNHNTSSPNTLKCLWRVKQKSSKKLFRATISLQVTWLQNLNLLGNVKYNQLTVIPTNNAISQIIP